MTMETRREHSEFNKTLESAYSMAEAWYDTDSVYYGLQVSRKIGGEQTVPADVTSRQFAEWLAGQYRHAMAKGIFIGRSGQ